jgi:hypothetical protein
MNDESLHDPQLKSFEARLASRPPQVSLAQRDQLLYACAFAAGRDTAGRSLRRWRTAAAALSVVVAGATMALVRDSSPSARVPIERATASERSAHQRPVEAVPDPPAKNAAAADLDAWQVPDTLVGQRLSEQLALWEHSDPHVRSLAVGALTRALSKP